MIAKNDVEIVPLLTLVDMVDISKLTLNEANDMRGGFQLATGGSRSEALSTDRITESIDGMPLLI